MIEFMKNHFGTGKKRQFLTCFGFVLLALMVFTTMIWTYSSLHFIPLILQFSLFAYSFFLAFVYKKTIVYSIMPCLPFIVSAGVSLLLNGYNSNYNTLATGILIFLSIQFFMQIVPNKKDLFIVFYCAIYAFVIYFLLLYSNDIISMIKNANLNDIRFGEKIAPINMITIYFDICCVFSLLLFLLGFERRKVNMIIIGLIFYMLGFICGLLTGSKQFIIVTLCVNIISTFIIFGKKKIYISFAILLFLIVLVVLIFTIPTFQTIASRLEDAINAFFGFDNRDFSTASRAFMFDEALYFFTQRPIFGYGIWGYASIGSFGTYSHNTFSNLLCEFGFLGFVSFLFFVFCWFSKPHKKNIFDLSLFFCLFAQFLFGVVYTHKFTYIIIALLYSGQCIEKRNLFYVLFKPKKYLIDCDFGVVNV